MLLSTNSRNFRETRRLQRLFSTFPGGAPGVGLLLLRAALGISAIVQSAIYLSEQSDSSFGKFFVGIAAIICGVSMTFGFLTPVIGALLFTGGLTTLIVSFSTSIDITSSPLIYEIILSAALILLGPGAFSIDARAFGRREIVIPKN